jgi:CheY-like chemotaxis protein
MPKMVLVVDDDEDLLATMEDLLRLRGYGVVTATNGQEALARVEERLPELILLDMRMPVMDGWEFVAAFRLAHRVPTPIVVVTAAPDAQSRALKVEANAWLAKPFDVKDLFATLERYL